MKIAVLWSRLSGYMNSCLQLLASQPGIDLFIAHEEGAADAPFAEAQFAWMEHVYRFKGTADSNELLAKLGAFEPELLLVSGWNIAAYRAACEKYRGRCGRMLCMDNPWEGKPKQWLGVMTAPVFIRRLFDGAFVAGERQAQFASRLGFSQTQIWRGVLTADHPSFAQVHEQRLERKQPLPESFMYVGRFSAEKGIATLAQAYELYRRESDSPWPLIVAGAGPMSETIARVPGTQMIGFVQPKDLPQTLASAGCFVMPSNWDHWGIAIHEACAAGLPVICTSTCGSSVHLVQDGYNGRIVDPHNPVELAGVFKQISGLAPEVRAAMGHASHQLSLQFTPELWVRKVVDRGTEVLSCSAGRGRSIR